MSVGTRIRSTGAAVKIPTGQPTYDYYVDPVKGAGTNAGTSPTAAFRTVEEAVAAIGTAGGKSVCLMAGSYPVVTINTSFDAEVIFRSPIQHAASIRSFVSNNGLDNITFKDVEFFLPSDSTPYPNPNNAPSLVQIFGPATDTNFLSSRIVSENLLRTREGIKFSGLATRVLIQDCEIGRNLGGVRFAGGMVDSTVEDCRIHGISTGAIANQGNDNSTGGAYRRNHIFDYTKRTEEDEWTTDDSPVPAPGTHDGLHRSLISVRDFQGLEITENVFHSIDVPWIQFYAGEGRVYQYADIIFSDNLFYDCGPFAAFIFQKQPADSERTGKFVIERNSVFIRELPGYDPATATDVTDRFFGNSVAADFNDPTFAGDSMVDNLIITRALLPNWSNNNVIWAGGEPGTNNKSIEVDHPTDFNWIEGQLVDGTYHFGGADDKRIRMGLTFQPKADSFLATAGVGGTHVGAVAPAS